MRGQITEVCSTAIAMMGMWVMDKNATVRCTLEALFTHNEIQPHIFTVRNEVAKVMFLQASVCPRRGGGGGVCLSACFDTTHSPRADTPREQTPPGSRHPPRADTHTWRRHPPEQTPSRKQTPPLGADTPPLPEIRSLLRTVRILLECILVT